jgi:hypothetical protein
MEFNFTILYWDLKDSLSYSSADGSDFASSFSEVSGETVRSEIRMQMRKYQVSEHESQIEPTFQENIMYMMALCWFQSDILK